MDKENHSVYLSFGEQGLGVLGILEGLASGFVEADPLDASRAGRMEMVRAVNRRISRC
jgi:hypothetical protein